jgi:hypothetical protein
VPELTRFELLLIAFPVLRKLRNQQRELLSKRTVVRTPDVTKSLSPGGVEEKGPRSLTSQRSKP